MNAPTSNPGSLHSRPKRGGAVKGSKHKRNSGRLALAVEFSTFLRNGLEKLPVFDWIARVAVDDPAKATELYVRASEYVTPRLVRSEVGGPGGSGPVTIVIRNETSTE